jgi:AbrB family looped-hinge helix DNA binding protein
MLVKLSSKGQLVIPKPIREALRLHAGTRFDVRLRGGKIILEPVGPSIVDSLYGKYADTDFLADLEDEHQREMMTDEAAVRP